MGGLPVPGQMSKLRSFYEQCNHRLSCFDFIGFVANLKIEPSPEGIVLLSFLMLELKNKLCASYIVELKCS